MAGLLLFWQLKLCFLLSSVPVSVTSESNLNMATSGKWLTLSRIVLMPSRLLLGQRMERK